MSIEPTFMHMHTHNNYAPRVQRERAYYHKKRVDGLLVSTVALIIKSIM